MKTITGHDGRLNQTVGGTEIIDNLRTIKIVAGKTTSWFALDFGCARIRQRMDFGPDGASELDLVTLLPGEPSQELFAIPDDYKEGPPSTLATVKCSPPCSQENLRKYFERLDMSYSTHRAY
jgi:hypothetical protein